MKTPDIWGDIEMHNEGGSDSEEKSPKVSTRKKKVVDDAEMLDGDTTYKSRRLKLYNDDISEDEADKGYEATESGSNKYVNTQGIEISNRPNPRFKNYRNLFDNLLKISDVTTMYPICSVMITYDSSKAITVTKKDDREYYIKMYSLESYDMVFEEKIGGEPSDYIKLKEVE